MIEHKIQKHTRGFTLVELMVSLGLFGIVVVISLGSLLGVFDANSRSQSMASVMNNLNYTLDSMTRNIRFASSYHCGSTGSLSTPQNCFDNSVGDTTFAVTTGSQVIVYRYNATNKAIEKSVNGGATYTPITGSEVTIEYARFRVFGVGTGDNVQPYALLVLRGYAGSKPSTKSTFDLQTIISQRKLDL